MFFALAGGNEHEHNEPNRLAVQGIEINAGRRTAKSEDNIIDLWSGGVG